MEQHGGTTSLRNAAARWSLDGDKKLLELLQNIHQKVVHKCKETNAMIEQMMTSLDEANIDAQNVNNRFISLSNSQFVERRVYSDDADIASEPPPLKQSPQPARLRSEASLKSSLLQLESHHDLLEIYPDSDSDSDGEMITSVVLKPKNPYSERPLPYIIGTSGWRNKWHAGTIPSESESSSARSRSRASQYSESGSEPGTQSNWPPNDDTLSENTIPAPADIASELARRLGNIPQTSPSNTTYEPPKMTNKIYKSAEHVTGTIFPDEPPPLPQLSDADSDQLEEDNDIFADIHNSNLRVEETKNISVRAAEQNSTLTQEDTEPELFTSRIPTISTKENIVKKPVGGISLFGTNRGTETIGAAILKRNQRKSSSDDDAGSDDKPVVKPKPNTNKNDGNKEASNVQKDIFEDLFAKSKISNKNNNKKGKETVVKAPEVNKKVDLFKDDIFDDIDDIFTSNIVSSASKNEPKQPKSIFDDDDQLFSEVAITKPLKDENKSKSSAASESKGLFDSDDELFSDKVVIDSIETNKIGVDIIKDVENKVSAINEVKESSIFDDSSDDGLFSDVDVKKPPVAPKTTLNINKEKPFINTKPIVSEINTKTEDKSITNLVSSPKQATPDVTNIVKEKYVPFQSPSIFDDDVDDIFTNTPKSATPKIEINADRNISVTESVKSDITQSDNGNLSEKQQIIIKDDDLFTDNIKDFDDKICEKNTVKESDIDNFYTSKPEQVIEKPIADLTKNIVAGNIETAIFEKDELNEDLAEKHQDVTDQQTVIEREIQEKRNLELEKSLEQSLLQHNETPEVLQIFNDEPPDFEIPKEPKKSKNINALFDDDSDDEALFFKKEDPVLDEQPDVFDSNSKPNLFGIFHDEPPDCDFTAKDEKVTKVDINKQIDESQLENNNLNEAKVDIKKIGKLKVNLNINVNTLLPGASPKKTQKPIVDKTNTQTDKPETSNDKPASSINEIPLPPAVYNETNDFDSTETDGQILSTETIFKSVSFDKNPESSVLDNQLSKQRAKIQVKRRPSSRRARHEAVRKSIRDNQDESNDSTDNSSSVDDHRSKPRETDDAGGDENEDKKIATEINETKAESDKIESVSPKDEAEPKYFDNEVNAEVTNNSNAAKDVNYYTTSNITNSKTKQKNIKTKIVYILNDEDIFNTDNNAAKSSDKQTDEQNTSKQSKILKIVDDNDTKPANFKSMNEPKSIAKVKTTLFDDLSDDEALFKPKTQSKKPVTIFGSDSDDEIFFGKKTETKTSAVERKREMGVKKTLFSDDDDDNLFGAKKKTDQKPSQRTPATSTARSSYPPTSVDDPLSNLEDDYSF